ncbi:uncharacterized protein KIAA1958-like [Haliotis rufescens]|uniref:uncharacterized protein KIAA1958-like n=1 Tax=Haliotis rufescens TaxID=6454 RepID=UPI00201EB329|nr:uncharacterized protein KIAA1958-like [Haliotis rufescens]
MDADDDDLFLTQSVFKESASCADKESDDFKFRFGDLLSEREIAKKIEICVPRTTRYKNDWAFSTFKRWQEERKSQSIADNLELPQKCLTEDIVEMSLSTMNTAFKYFLFEARKLDGAQYTADTVHGLFTALQSGLRLKGRKNINLFEDQQFEESRTCLDALMKELSKKGLGSSARKKTETISMDDEERLWSSGSLGEDDPQQLVDINV